MNKTKNYDFTTIVPIYNKEDNMGRLVRQLSTYTAKALVKTCVLLVDDSSKDRSLGMMKKACLDSQNFFYITPEVNHGLNATMRAGVDMAGSRYIGYIDTDLQINPEDLNKLLAFIQDYQLVSGIQAERKDTGLKRLQSKFANGSCRVMTGNTATDTGYPLKVMWTNYTQCLLFSNGMHRFLSVLLTLAGGKFMEVPVRHYPRTAGISKYYLLNGLMSPLTDCSAFRWLKRRYICYQIKDNNL